MMILHPAFMSFLYFFGGIGRGGWIYCIQFWCVNAIMDFYYVITLLSLVGALLITSYCIFFSFLMVSILHSFLQTLVYYSICPSKAIWENLQKHLEFASKYASNVVFRLSYCLNIVHAIMHQVDTCLGLCTHCRWSLQYTQTLEVVLSIQIRYC